MKKIVVLGGSGMLGSMVTDFLSKDDETEVAATVRDASLAEKCSVSLPQVEWRLLDVTAADNDVIFAAIRDAKWVINAIGLTKPYIHDDDRRETERAIKVNALFPHKLAHVATEAGASVLQIGTDCVYSGTRGHYVESDPHDALDVYGKTKSLGECTSPNLHCLRCSIVGPEPKAHVFLLEWLRRQPRNARVRGYTNHQWNGITTLHFARICQGIIRQDLDLPHVQHIVPSGIMSKFELLRCFARAYDRLDIDITPTNAQAIIDRTLSSTNKRLNQSIWRAAGYGDPPSLQQMVEELAQYGYRMQAL
jgi:dTDP-4-dehydrorhamnose reductase